MTLEQTTSEKSDLKGSRITTKRTIKTFIPKGAQEKTTPWGVTLKPVPRKSTVESSSIDSETKTKTKSHNNAVSKSALPIPATKSKIIPLKVRLSSNIIFSFNHNLSSESQKKK